MQKIEIFKTSLSQPTIVVEHFCKFCSSFLIGLVSSILVSLTCCNIATSKTLTGTIKHKESMPSIDPSLRAGAMFDQSKLPAQETSSKWFRIPKWMAGEWKRKYRTIKKAGIKFKVKDSRVRRFGFQTDSVGAVWHWVRVPFNQRNVLRSHFGHSVVNDESMVERTENSFTIRTTYTTWYIEKRSSKIVKVNQGDQIDKFTYKDRNHLSVESSCQHYNQLGARESTTNTAWVETRSEPYKPVSQFHNIDVRRVFKSYLLSKGLDSLIRDDQSL